MDVRTRMRPTTYTYAISGGKCYCYPHKMGGQTLAFLWQPDEPTVHHDRRLMRTTARLNQVLRDLADSPPSAELELSFIEFQNRLFLVWSETLGGALTINDEPYQIGWALGLPNEEVRSSWPDEGAFSMSVSGRARPQPKFSFVLRPSGLSCWKGGSDQYLTRLWQAERPTEFHDVRLMKATERLNDLLADASESRPSDLVELCFIRFQNRLLLAWSQTQRDAVWAGDDPVDLAAALGLSRDDPDYPAELS